MLAAAKLLSRRAFLMATAAFGLGAVHRAAMPARRRDAGRWRPDRIRTCGPKLGRLLLCSGGEVTYQGKPA